MSNAPPPFDELRSRLSSYMNEESIQFVESAFVYSSKCHEGQIRKSGQPYISHPIEVALILADLNQGKFSVAASLLHDVLEDTDASSEDLKSRFGDEVTQLVEGVTKLGKLYFGTSEEAQAENYRKMFLAMASDLRVVVIKLADRLHNMRTLKYLREDKQRRIAKETLDIFAPLAYRLGMGSLKWELEDLAMMALYPDDFQSIKEVVSTKREEREVSVKQVIEVIKLLLEDSDVSAEISGRPKHFFSIFRKLKSGDDYREIYDLLGIRIITKTEKDCYEILGLIHSKYKPVAGRIKDYIALPKTNMYQSLHTTVIGPEGQPVEVQIRTEEMHRVAEYGVAAHWQYKEGQTHTQDEYKAKFSWLSQILSSYQEEENPDEFIKNLKLDLFGGEVFVFSPKGDVQVMPKGATPLDFAYRIHTEIGHKTRGAKVNGHIVTLNYTLKSGDRIEIISSNVESPKLDWLEFVKTRHAKIKIKAWFRKQHSSEKQMRAKEEIERTLVKNGYLMKDFLDPPTLRAFLDQIRLDKIETVYLSVANGDVGLPTIVRFMDKVKGRDMSVPKTVLEDVIPASDRGKKVSILGVSVLGERNVEVYLAKCCHPLPGDKVIGFVTMGYGVAVHRSGCSNIKKLSDQDRARLIDVDWEIEDKSSRIYPVTLDIEGYDRIGLLKDIVDRISESNTNIMQANSSAFSNGRAKVTIRLQVQDLVHLDHLKKIITSIPDVIDVYRSH